MRMSFGKGWNFSCSFQIAPQFSTIEFGRYIHLLDLRTVFLAIANVTYFASEQFSRLTQWCEMRVHITYANMKELVLGQ